MNFENWRVSLTIETPIFIVTNNWETKIAALFALVLIKIRRKKQEKLFWSVCLYLLFLETVKFLNSIASYNKQKQVTNKHDWTHAKYLNVLYHNRTQKQLQYFFLNILQKHYQLPILGTSGHFHQKWKCQLVKTLMFICMQKNELHS